MKKKPEKLGHEKNEYGTLVTRFKCQYCGDEFTVCPAVLPDEEHSWDGCTQPHCESYNINRDADLLFDTGQTDNIKKAKTAPPQFPLTLKT